jgi:hypothetical protein
MLIKAPLIGLTKHTSPLAIHMGAKEGCDLKITLP